MMKLPARTPAVFSLASTLNACGIHVGDTNAAMLLLTPLHSSVVDGFAAHRLFCKAEPVAT